MLKLSAIILWILAAVGCSVQAAACKTKLATLVSLEGQVDALRHQSSHWKPSSLGDNYCFGDRIRVARDSRASLELSNDTVLRLDQLTMLLLPEPELQHLSFVELLKGALHLISRVKTSLEIRTPFVSAGLEGTEFVVRVLEEEAVVSVIEGQVSVGNAYGRLHLKGGQTASAGKDSAPVLRLDLQPDDAVQWALYYPMITDPATPGLARGIAEAQRQLLVGRVEEAKALIDGIVKRDPGNSEALGLRAVIELAQNRKAEASTLAENALTKDESAAALLAMSFAQQANFDLAAARATTSRAISLYPKNALLWARLAELQASLGERDEALASARRAVELDPNLSRTQTVLGFSHLTASQTTSAQSAFEKAIQFDSADPLPRLGLGLAKIREGNLADGRREMEIAVSLDPANSLVRSYLGKAYFEESRSEKAEIEFALAKRLDPLDPTPWLYDALRKQADNQPVAAAKDFERSVTLNDNRAVYRSRLLLDNDLAIRNASVGATYAALGLRDVARRHATRSVALDPSDASGHALLATSYTGVPRLGIARLSEQLQARLLQPLTARPIAPSGLIRELDPSAGLERFAVGANEYTSLFENYDPRFYLTGFVGGNNSSGYEVVHSKLFEKASYSIGYYRFDTDGFRPNADFNHETYNGFAQYAVSDRFSLLFEARHQNKDQGDLRLDPRILFFPEDRSLDSDLFRAGAKLDMTDRTRLLLALSYADRREKGILDESPLIENYADARNAWLIELQLLHRGDRLQIIAGAGFRWVDVNYKNELLIGFFDPFIPLGSSSGSEDIRSSSVYVYTNWAVTDDVLFTLGLSHDDHADPRRQRSKVEYSRLNPKIGIQWRATPWLNVRAAHVATTKHQLVVEETIEPTQVAGFVQFFDDFNRTESNLNAIALDLRASDALSGIIEFTRRSSDEVQSPNSLLEKNFRAQLSVILSDRWTATLGYERLSDDTDGARQFFGSRTGARQLDLRTELIPVSLRYHDSNGIFGQLNWTVFDQELNPRDRPSVGTRFNAVSGIAGYAWNKQRNRIMFGVDDALNDVDEYLDDRHKTNDIFGDKSKPYQPFVPGRTYWGSIEIAWD